MEVPPAATVGPIPSYADVDAMVPDCQACQRCKLAATRRHAAVYRGSPRARLLLIGEGPGEQEDRQGKPFVGPAGQLLDRILASVALDPAADVFITNVVKCRPPGNRVPEPDEIAACRPFLLEQLRLVDPALVVFVGGTAFKGCTGESQGITRVRGSWGSGGQMWQHRARAAMAGTRCKITAHCYCG